MPEKDNELMKNLAVNVGIYRTKMNLSSKKLSRMIGKSPNFIDKLEHLELTRVPALYVVIALCYVFKVSLDDLVGENYIENMLKEQ